MPCNSDYLEPTSREKEHQRAAKLLVYVYRCLNVSPIPAWITSQANDPYASAQALIPTLCAKLRELTPAQREEIVYDAHSPNSRDLADWWETHQLADVKRLAEERKKASTNALKKRALAKLSKAERKALGF